ncbi:hypothetical protein ACQKGI_20045 [Peribacillus muralis]|uniref:hypothetical protein n=1 Tax=Peribacillus muralis TaxID=264697 RepID=UPI0037F608EB
MNVKVDEASHQVIEISLKGIEVFSIVASVFSIVLGIVAIWLSVVFYKMSEKSSKEIEKSSNAINSNVEKLDVLFDKMYTDTFGMVKETVSDMRQYVYKSNGTKEEPDKMSLEIERKTKQIANDAIKDLQKDKLSKTEVESLVKRIIKESTQVAQEFENESMIKQIKRLLKQYGSLTYLELKKKLLSEDGSPALFNLLEKMVEMDLIHDPFSYNLEDSEKGIMHSARIKLK